MSISPRLAQMLLHRGIEDPAAAERYLYGGFQDLSRPEAILNLPAAAERLLRAIQEGTSIVVYGDYDVDGMSASVLLHRALRDAGAKVEIYIPSRQSEGYGLNAKALEKLMTKGVRLLVTVDNGIAAADILAPFIERGLEVIVTDHHQLPEELPGGIVVNPLLDPDETVPFRRLCGAGIAFMLARAVLEGKAGRRLDEEALGPYLLPAALATVADIVPLKEDNRLLVKAGLALLREGPIAPGIEALIEVAGLDRRRLDAHHIAFQLAPRLNACGRLDRVDLALRLLQSEDVAEAAALALEINGLNDQRKGMEQTAYEAAVAALPQELPMALIAVGEDWNAGVIGIVASRLMEAYQRPALVLTPKESDPEILTGSGRAPDGFHLYQALAACSEALIQFGGHAKAAGFSVARKDLPRFEALFLAHARSTAADWLDLQVTEIDALLRPSAVDPALWQEVQALEPTGYDNARPLFAMESVPEMRMRAVGKEGAHLQVQVPVGEGVLKGIAFRYGDYPYKEGVNRHDVLFTLTENVFRGQASIELMVQELRPSFWAASEIDNALFSEGRAYLDDDGYAGIEDRASFVTKLVGVSFEDRQSLLAQLPAEAALSLRREPANPHDPHAIAVDGPQGQLGYLKRALALRLAPLLDQGITYRVTALERTGGDADRHWGLNISCERIDAAPERPAVRVTDAGAVAELLLDGRALHAVQAEALAALEAGENLLLVMGTGRGKSLVYQCHAAHLALQKKAVTVVFFPLRALLEDQYLAVQPIFAKLGLQARRLFGDSGASERRAFERAWQAGEVDLVLTTPEYFLYHRAMFAEGPRTIGCFVMDEAHYLMSRRDGYRALVDAMGETSAQLLALTATLPDGAETAIVEPLGLDRVLVDPARRENLRLVDERGTLRKPPYLLELAKTREKTIVYVNSRRGALEMAEALRSVLPSGARSRVNYFHGGLGKAQREWLLEAFRSGHIRMLIATTAFGEGMNIPDVRHVVLYHLCFSDACFNQLAGRAGRDGEVSYVHLLYGERDRSLNERILRPLCPNRQDLAGIYKEMAALLRAEGMPRRALLSALGAHPGRGESSHRHALRIFIDLSLIKQEERDGEVVLSLVPQADKRALTDSALYLEGREEWAAFEAHCKTAFSKDREALAAMIQRPLVPQPLTSKEGTGYDENRSV